jgi:hypothetical protein
MTARSAPAIKAELVGAGIGSIAAHEAGHFFGNFHTWLYSDRIDVMDGNPYSLDATLGVGLDGWFGTADDIDVDFGVDDYTLFEGFRGRQDTLNTIAFGLSTGRIRRSTTLGAPALRVLAPVFHLPSAPWNRLRHYARQPTRPPGSTLASGDGTATPYVHLPNPADHGWSASPSTETGVFIDCAWRGSVLHAQEDDRRLGLSRRIRTGIRGLGQRMIRMGCVGRPADGLAKISSTPATGPQAAKY